MVSCLLALGLTFSFPLLFERFSVCLSFVYLETMFGSHRSWLARYIGPLLAASLASITNKWKAGTYKVPYGNLQTTGHPQNKTYTQEITHISMFYPSSQHNLTAGRIIPTKILNLSLSLDPTRSVVSLSSSLPFSLLPHHSEDYVCWHCHSNFGLWFVFPSLGYMLQR